MEGEKEREKEEKRERRRGKEGRKRKRERKDHYVKRMRLVCQRTKQKISTWKRQS